MIGAYEHFIISTMPVFGEPGEQTTLHHVCTALYNRGSCFITVYGMYMTFKGKKKMATQGEARPRSSHGGVRGGPVLQRPDSCIRRAIALGATQVGTCMSVVGGTGTLLVQWHCCAEHRAPYPAGVT